MPKPIKAWPQSVPHAADAARLASRLPELVKRKDRNDVHRGVEEAVRPAWHIVDGFFSHWITGIRRIRDRLA